MTAITESRCELQGVVGHEFSHILNGDRRLNLHILGVIFGILSPAVIGRVLIFLRDRGSRERNPLMLLGLALIIIGAIGVFFGRFIQVARDCIALAAPKLKKVLIEACVHVVSADGVIKEREAELLRAIADTPDCPIPSFVEAVVS